jgi:C3HC zinc finger-like
MSPTVEMNQYLATIPEIPRHKTPLIVEIVPDTTEPMHPADQAAADIRQQLDRLFSSPLPSSPTKQRDDEQRRAQYRQRLQSFTTVGYFAQPIHLSPIICALAGWELQSKNDETVHGVLRLPPSSSLCDSAARLSCPSCHAEVMLWIPSVLSTTGQMDLVAQYQQLLWKSHAMHCRHRKEAEYLINTALKPPREPPNVSSVVVPTLLARALPSPSTTSDVSSLELVEQPNPFPIFGTKWRQFYSQMVALSEAPVQLPDTVLQFDWDATSSCGTLLTRLVDRIQEKEDQEKPAVVNLDHALGRSAAEAAAAMVLLGWELLLSGDAISDATNDSNPPASIHCVFCLAQHPLIKRSEDHLLSRKRPRDAVFSLWNQPWAAHRHYCPWVGGFPQTGRSDTTRPLWEGLAARLLRTGCDHPDDDPPSSVVRQQIRAGVSPVRFSPRPLRK